jgi:hypothetical protein
MSDRRQGSTGFSLRRWSQRKLEAARKDDPARRPEASGDAGAAPGSDSSAQAGAMSAAAPLQGAAPSPAIGTPDAARGAEPGARSEGQRGAPSLPPLESLTIDSDYSPFMQTGVDEDVKRAALRKLLRDPRFNVMDGLDVYIDDYSKPSPIEPELVRTLMQARYIFNPPRTRVNEQGNVEDVPDDPAVETADEPLAQSADTASDATDPPGVAAPAGHEAVGERTHANAMPDACVDAASRDGPLRQAGKDS